VQTQRLSLGVDQAHHTVTQQSRDLKRTLAQAQTLLKSGAAIQTLDLLNGLKDSELLGLSRDLFYTLRAQAHSSLNNPIEAYRALTQLSQVGTEHWQLLRQVLLKT
jgi:phenylalanine-4-hydroxylase